jgi:uncharacterized protein with NRDE domain
MCLLIFAHQVLPDVPLLVAANRDEFHSRPTAASDFWPERPQLLAGRDLLQGGTWMGVTRSGRFAAVTNYRDPARTAAAPRSRGELPLGFLAGAQTPEDFLREVAARARDYAGFNLLVGDRHALWYFTNSASMAPRLLPAGIYGLSNASLDTPWPKVERGKALLKSLLSGDEAGGDACASERIAQPAMSRGRLSHDALLDVVGDRQLADPGALRAQGLDGAMDPVLSAQFIVTGGYGTRSSTTLWFEARHQVNWREHSYNEHGQLRDVRQKAFSLDAN